MENNNSIKEQMIALIEKNRISSVEVADALGKTGVIEGPQIFNPGKSCVGEVQYIFGHSGSNWPIHEQAHYLKEGGIVYIDTFECDNKAAFGDLVSKYLMLYKRMKGMVVNGLLRDAHTIRKENYAAWCTGVTPLGCNNVDTPVPAHIEEEAKKRKEYFDGSIMVCDDSGCTLISKENINEQTLKKLEFMELQEDIWYYCLDTLKWSTYEVVCLKKYLENEHELPAVLVQKFKELSS